MDKQVSTSDLDRALLVLQMARQDGDKLTIELAEDAMNDLLDRYTEQMLHVTTERTA